MEISKEQLIDSINKEKDQLLETQTGENMFPTHVFPDSIQQIIQEANKSLKYNLDFFSSSLLYTASVAIGNSFKVKVKNGWEESSTLYMAIVGNAGTNKSHPLSWAVTPLHNRQKEYFELYNDKIKEFEKTEKSSKQKGETQTTIEKPILQKIIASDCTQEALVSMLANNQRGIGVCVDELNGWISSFNQYKQGNDEEFWLSIWSGKAVSVDRKHHPSIYIPTPYVSVCGTIQTKLIQNLSKGKKEVNGFIDRVLMVFPQNIKKEYLNEIEMDNYYTDKWDRIITSILDINPYYQDDNSHTPIVIIFSTEAKKTLINWIKKNTDLINNTEDEALKGIYTKLESYCIRFSLILEVLNCTCNTNPISQVHNQSVEGAIDLVNYFKRNAELIKQKVKNKNPLEDLSNEEKRFYNQLPEVVPLAKAKVIRDKCYKFSDSTLRRFLNNTILFSKSKHGVYEKIA